MLQRLSGWFRTTKSLSAPDAELQAVFGALPSGLGVGTAQALTVPAVQSAIRLLSEASACLDLRVERRVGGAWIEAPEHPAAALLGSQPNDWQSSYELIRDMVAAALITDKGSLALANKVDGRTIELVRYEPGHFTVDYSGDGRLEPSYRINNTPVSADDVVHLRSPFARCPLSLAADAIGVAKTLEEHAGRLFKNGARPSGVLSLKDRVTPEALKRIREAWAIAHGNGKSGGTAIVEGGAEYAQLTMLSTDGQFLENRTFQLQEIARAFRVPPTMIYELSRGTFSTTEALGRDFLVFSLDPWLQALEGALRRALFAAGERREYRVKFDRDDLTRASLTERATAIASLIASRVLNPNEGRSWLDLPPREGGEEYANPNTGSNQPGGQIGAAAPPPTPDQREDDA
ncbi:phage portal protein [Ancylobacter vacuolatus]|uniref:HK97 family phage portal protein n=1 Tax=Ancylobacter vacuolatus TaxID=223389 RepID=A0ABU0DHE3_9HYPH|nr:phage portal protein [Ancylobacter vacuolatus]MDQ0347851.1 HK97 family phage portal protein [Ancylobacter vacuolatus]